MTLIHIRLGLLLGMGALCALGESRAQVPQIINYQGRISVGGTNFSGTGQFQFALVSPAGTVAFWSNGLARVSLPVTHGLYSVGLGDTSVGNMTFSIPATVFTNTDVWLRIWFDDGVHGLRQFSPDQRIAAVGYALMAANVPDGSITVSKIASGAVTSLSIAPASIGSVQLAAGAVTASHLDLSVTNTVAARDHPVILNALTNASGPGLSIVNNTVTLTTNGWRFGGITNGQTRVALGLTNPVVTGIAVLHQAPGNGTLIWSANGNFKWQAGMDWDMNNVVPLNQVLPIGFTGAGQPLWPTNINTFGSAATRDIIRAGTVPSSGYSNLNILVAEAATDPSNQVAFVAIVSNKRTNFPALMAAAGGTNGTLYLNQSYAQYGAHTRINFRNRGFIGSDWRANGGYDLWWGRQGFSLPDVWIENPSGNVGIGGITNPVAKLHVNGSFVSAGVISGLVVRSGSGYSGGGFAGGVATQAIISGSAPALSNSAGVPGQIAYDATYFYLCIATNQWRRAALGTW